MGQSSSLPVDVDYSNVPTLGYRVLGVQPDSPASNAGLVSFFDFLVGSNGRMLFGGSTDEDDEGKVEMVGDVDFISLLQESVGKELELLVFNIKSQKTRLCYVTPSSDWGGAGLLGVTIRVDSYAHAEDNLLRVLSVMDSSPAQMAGLKSETDYLLGTKTASFTSDDILFRVLQHNCDKVLEIYVYNTESDVVRVLNIMPTYSWGGGGLLGAEVGMGYLHKIPNQCRSTDGSSFEKKVKLPIGKLPTTTSNGTEESAPNGASGSLKDLDKDKFLPQVHAKDISKTTSNNDHAHVQIKSTLEISENGSSAQNSVRAANPKNEPHSDLVHSEGQKITSRTSKDVSTEAQTFSSASHAISSSPSETDSSVPFATCAAPISAETTSSVPPLPISSTSDDPEMEKEKTASFSSYLPPPPFSFRSS